MEHLSVRIAQTRLRELRIMQQELMKTQEPDGVWDWFLEKEMLELINFIALQKKNDRRPGQSLGLRSHLKSLLSSILTLDREKRKEGAA